MKNDLFNESLMKRLSSDKKLQKSITKHDIIKAHVQKLENGDFKSEVSNYIYFYEKFLKSILGYDLDKNIDHEKKFGRGKVEFSLKNDDNEDFMVIELKDQTVDLDKPQHRTNDKRTPVEQAWGYLKDAPTVNWIMVSNFHEFRLYNIEERGKRICFTIDELLDPEKFLFFMIAFSKRSHIEKGYAEDIMHETILDEKQFENNFYKLYHETRLMLINELEQTDLTKERAIHYAQKVLNRYMFICFAEDIEELLPTDISKKTILSPIQSGDMGDTIIWSRLNELFHYINVGNDFKDINKYNGGLFKEDLSFLKVRDTLDDHSFFKDTWQKWNFEDYSQDINELLSPHEDVVNPIYKNLLIISRFNFSTELDVNILGHVFENSIGDLEKLKEDPKSRRKKEGIFYTPEYITDYICRNTIIPYLSRTGKTNTVPELIGEYWGSEINTLDQKVKNIKIVDPACGSGAFLNKAADVLLEIHEAIHNELYKDNKTLDKHFDTVKERRSILLNNIYGVDLNEESVEITKLSLFLKVCKKGLELPNLDKNIRCGNSIIDDKKYAGDKAFNWNTKFPDILPEGFDIVIGNPPYIRQERFREVRPYFKNNYSVFAGRADLYVYFFEKGLDILKDGGMFSYITSNKFIKAKYGQNLRRFILKNAAIQRYMDHTWDKIFEDATVHSCVIVLKKTNEDSNIIKINEKFELDQSELDEDTWSFVEPKILDLKEKINNKGIKLKDIHKLKIIYGIKTGYNNAFIIDSKTKKEITQDDSLEIDIIKPILRGKDIQPNQINWKGYYIILSRYEFHKKLNEYPVVLNYLEKYEDKLKNRGQVKNGQHHWLELDNNPSKDFLTEFTKPKLIYPIIVPKLLAVYDENGFYTNDKCFIITGESSYLKYISILFSSKMLDFVFKLMGSTLEGERYEMRKIYVERLPIYPATPEEQQPFIDLADMMLDFNKQLQVEVNGFLDWLRHTFSVEKLSQKLEKYYELDHDTFLDELRKKKVDVKSRKNYQTLKKEFEESVAVISPLQQQIQTTDDEIDRMVYELYGLTDDEIKIIEENL